MIFSNLQLYFYDKMNGVILELIVQKYGEQYVLHFLSLNTVLSILASKVTLSLFIP